VRSSSTTLFFRVFLALVLGSSIVRAQNATVAVGGILEAPEEPAVTNPSWAGLTVVADVGVGFAGEVTALGREVAGLAASSSFSLEQTTGIGPLLLRTGVELLYVRRRVSIVESQFRTQTFRPGLEILVGKSLCSNLLILAGGEVRTQRDLKEFDIREHANIRYDLRAVVAYRLRERWSTEAVYAYGLQRQKSSAFVADPRSQLRIGLAYTLLP